MVCRGQVARVVAESVQNLGLTKFEHKMAGTLSGGNKRKLSVAIALIAEPPIIFLGAWLGCGSPRVLYLLDVCLEFLDPICLESPEAPHLCVFVLCVRGPVVAAITLCRRALHWHGEWLRVRASCTVLHVCAQLFPAVIDVHSVCSIMCILCSHCRVTCVSLMTCRIPWPAASCGT